MKKRILGNDLEVSAVGFGCMGMTHTFGAVDEGYSIFDTAEVYVSDDGSDEHNEDLVGAALQPLRDKVKIATKFGISFGADGFVFHASPEQIRASLETSLRRLRTDYVDLYYLHRYNPADSIEDIAGTMSRLIEEGKITHWGISTVGEDVIRRAHKVCPLTAVQNQFSMLHRNMEAPLSLYDELNIGLVTHCPLAKGFLSAAYDKNTVFPAGDWRGRMSMFTKDGQSKNSIVIEKLHELARGKDATPAQISLAYLLAKSPHVVPIPGIRRYERMVENAGAANVELGDSEIKEIDAMLDAADLTEM